MRTKFLLGGENCNIRDLGWFSSVLARTRNSLSPVFYMWMYSETLVLENTCTIERQTLVCLYMWVWYETLVPINWHLTCNLKPWIWRCFNVWKISELITICSALRVMKILRKKFLLGGENCNIRDLGWFSSILARTQNSISSVFYMCMYSVYAQKP